MDNSNPILVTAACVGLGLLGRCYFLPLENKSDNDKELTKMSLVKKLLSIMNSTKYQSKLRERAARSLGLLCVGEIFPHTLEVIRGLLNTAKEVTLPHNFPSSIPNIFLCFSDQRRRSSFFCWRIACYVCAINLV